jgi:hypothetical protein
MDWYLKVLRNYIGSYRSAGKTIPPMWFVEILLRAHGDDPRRVDGFVAAIIVIADMREIYRGIIAVGPQQDLNEPHGRDRFSR